MSAIKKQPESSVTLAPQWSGQVTVVELDQNVAPIAEALAVTDNLNPEMVLQTALDHNVNHICQRSHPFFDREVNSAALISADPRMFVQCPLASLLDPLAASASRERELTYLHRQFSKRDKKNVVLKEVESVLTGFTKSMTLINDVCSIVDELFTNAVFNAPFSKGGKTLSVARSGSSGTTEAIKTARVSLGINDNQIAVVCQDDYGSLDTVKLLNRIKNCYSQGVASNINMGSGGAGIGSYMVFNTCLSYFVAIEPGKRTTIAGLLPLKMSTRKRSAQPKNLHCVVYE